MFCTIAAIPPERHSSLVPMLTLFSVGSGWTVHQYRHTNTGIVASQRAPYGVSQWLSDPTENGLLSLARHHQIIYAKQQVLSCI